MKTGRFGSGTWALLLGLAMVGGGATTSWAQFRHHPARLVDEPPTPTQPAPTTRRKPPPRPAPHPIPPAPTPSPAPTPPLPAPPSPTPPPVPGPKPEVNAIASLSPATPILPDYPRRAPARLDIARQIRVNMAWQIALESADFSPGIIDGHFQRNGLMALTEFAARYFPGASPFDLRVYKALNVDADDAITTYTVTDDDAMQVGGSLPAGWNAKAKLDKLRYESLADCITEKFHCTRGLFEALNPDIKLAALAPGQTLNVPNLRPFPTDDKPTVDWRNSNSALVTVNLAEKTIRVFDKENREIALFHCSIARDKAKLPDRDTIVKAIAAPNPNYTFDPRNWPEVHNVSQVLTIPPGPRNPVGLAWVSLDLPGYGIHGSPAPELIGKTGSHGCFRLTNWDALKFAGLVKVGMEVKVINPEK